MKENKYDEKGSITYEASIRYLVEKSNRRAWFVAFLSIIIAIISVTAVCLLTPLKSVESYLVRVDNTTGTVDVISSIKVTDVTTSEALDKHFIANYVKLRQGYYYNILQQDYEKVQIYSNPEVAKDYIAIYADETNSRLEKLKNDYEVDIEIISIVLGESAGLTTSTVRFNEILKNAVTRTVDSKTSKVATLTYTYSTADVLEKERLINPLGFKVTTYRIDSEMIR